MKCDVFNESLFACNLINFYVFMRTIKSSRCVPFSNTHVSSVYKIVNKNLETYGGHSYEW